MKTENFASSPRRTIIYAIVLVSFGIIIFRLFQMQILSYRLYDEKSAGNSIKSVEQVPLRGLILDRNQTVLVENVPAYSVFIIPSDYQRSLNPVLEKLLGLETGYIDKILKQNEMYSKYLPVRIKKDADFSTVAWIEENSAKLPGVDYVVEMHRGYPSGVRGSHLFGYTTEISREQLSIRDDFYKAGDYIGQSGIEKTYENLLRGEKGFKYILVDSRRKEIGSYQNGAKDTPPVKGNDLILTIEAETQKTAEELFKNKRGALVAIEPETGEILALVSAPDFDLNVFSYYTLQSQLDSIYSHPGKPMFNRATMSVKPPGSTFKMLEAVAALDLGIINQSTTYFCGGGFTYGRFFKCHGVHGSINVVHAIEHSCNTYFYDLIFKIGMKNWYNYSKKFGFGEKTGIDIPDESTGLIPDEQYYVEKYGENWPRSIMASLGIGQGELSVTLLQLALYTALIANDGYSFTPHTVKGYIDTYSKDYVPLKFEQISTGINKEVFDVVKRGMYLVVNGKGTATHIKSDTLEIAGKTGTAQNPHGKDHALFVGFAPFENPKIVVAVIVENVGFGGTWAAPIAKSVIETYLSNYKESSDLYDTSEFIASGNLNEN